MSEANGEADHAGASRIAEAIARKRAEETKGEGGEKKAEPEWPPPIPSSQLKRQDAARKWIWHGYLARGQTTLLSALWKSGKSTLLAHLLRMLLAGGLFCDLRAGSARCLYITEEPESRWAERRDLLGLGDHVEFLVRPFLQKANWNDWACFLKYLRELQAAKKYDLLVMDTLTNLWPVMHENDAGEVQAALQPLQNMDAQLANLLVHHLKKADGQEATGSRGSGALTSFVDTIMELRRYDPTNRKDCRRVLTAYGRDEETYDELVIELAEGKYIAHGSRDQVRARTLNEILDSILPGEPPGMTWAQIADAWPGDSKPRRNNLLDALNGGFESFRYGRRGTGKRGSPYTFWRGPPDSVSVPTLYGDGTDTESAATAKDPFPD